ncbi:hypothetical protein PoB_003542100 [Plakobranchus ocellatus]|uniref:Uncharacterized protein n=1 Tax=Plakobranchus ocellatus TaxID=259542 RepID=A0AAV4AKU2_9GAST|nr:hypothetical protein PoB_003542100 [Plakobranchus ocellatus]
MHGDYHQQCISEDRRALGRKSFSETFKKLKFSIFQQCKDQCDICVGAKLVNVSEEKYDRPYDRKTLAQEEKKRDKDESDANTEVWTMDLQSVLTCPKTQASALYYKPN